MDETRTLYQQNGWTVEVHAEYADYMPAPDGDCYSPEDIALYGDTWDYVALHVTVELNDATIGDAYLGGVEHGQLADVVADAFELTPPEYGSAPDGTRTVTMGSPLSGVVIEAIDASIKWLVMIGAQVDMRPLVQTFDPNSL